LSTADDPPNAASVEITARPRHAATVVSRSGSIGVCARTSTPASAARAALASDSACAATLR
jgi:hypothetical protein